MAETSPTAETEVSTWPLLYAQRTIYGEPGTLTILSILFGLSAGRRGALTTTVRETIAEELADRRDNWGYSLPVVVIDTLWNLALVVISIVMLFWTTPEERNVSVMVWICVYAFQCAAHVLLMWLECRRRSRRASRAGSSSIRSSYGDSTDPDETSSIKNWDAYNRIVQYMWWLVALGLLLPNIDIHTSPVLFWLTLTCMAVDVFFASFGCLTRLITVLGVCFDISITLTFLDFIDRQRDVASESDVQVLPKYTFVAANEPLNVGGKMVPFETNDPEFFHDQDVLLEDLICCICLCTYEDGVELHVLPCKHPFHVACILKWLHIDNTCPLCKHLIGGEWEEVEQEEEGEQV